MRTATSVRRAGAAFILAILVVGGQTADAQTSTFVSTVDMTVGTAASGPFAPYPTSITVAGLAGVIQDVDVTLDSVSHTFLSDVDILLVAPNGDRMVLLSDAGGGAPGATNRTYRFDDEAVGAMGTGGGPVSGVYRPTNIGTGDAFPVPAPGVPHATTLAAFDGDDPNGTWSLYAADDAGGDGGIISGWRLHITTGVAPASLAAFSVSPAGANFATAGACSLPGVRRILTVAMSNFGPAGTTVNVLGAAVTGSSAYSIETVSPAPPTFPVALAGGGAAVNIGVAFFPSAGQTGPLNGTLTLSYNLDGGATQTKDILVSGTGDSEGAGWQFRSSVVDPSCAPDAGAPGTAFVIPAVNNRITTLTTGNLQDGRFRLDLSTVPTFPSFRMYGIDYSLIDITTNAVVGLIPTGSTSTIGTTNYGGTVTLGTTVLNVAAMNLNVDATVAADNLGVLGAPGFFWGVSDADADGDDDLVITWWHAYDNTTLPGVDGQYLTAQLILFQSNSPNEEDYLDMRYLDGNDANGVPFRQNTAVAGTDNSMENDAYTAVFEPQNLDASIYRLRNGTQNSSTAVVFGGPLYMPGGGSLGVRYEAEVQATATGLPGWRMMGVPVRLYTVGRLAGVNLVQGVTGQYPTYASNLYRAYNGTSWVSASSAADILEAGQGFIWYLYNQTFNPPDVDGTSNSFALPTPLEGTGAMPLVDGTGAAGVSLHANGTGWNLLANPWRDDINIAGMASWAAGGTLASIVGQVWEPDTQTYIATTTGGNLVSAWQGFMIQNNVGAAGAHMINVPNPMTTGGTFIGRTIQESWLGFNLSGLRADGSGATLDRAAVLYFAEEAADGWDVLDAGKLQPLADRYATIAFVGERDGEPVLKAHDSRPSEITSLQVPMAVAAVGTESELTLTWPDFTNVQPHWQFTLTDLVTGTEIDLRTESAYTFTVDPSEPRVASGDIPVPGDAPAALIDARFILNVSSATTGSGDGAPTVYALHAAAPNPIEGVSAIVRFDLPEAADASIEVFDMLGRRVAILAEGLREAGRHAARLDATALASGSYVMQMRAGDFVQTQRVTVAR